VKARFEAVRCIGWLGVLYPPTDNDEITFDTVQGSNLRQLTPARKTKSPEQSKARFIVAEDEAK